MAMRKGHRESEREGQREREGGGGEGGRERVERDSTEKKRLNSLYD